MKFTEEQAVEALRAELTNKGRKTLHMSERTLAKETAILIKKLATEETGLPDFVADVIEILNEYEGDARKKDSDYAKYKEAHPESNSQKEEPESPKADENPEIKALMDRIAALEADKEASDKQASIAKRKKDIVEGLKAKGVNDSSWIEKILSKANLDREDFKVEDEIEDYLIIYNDRITSGGEHIVPKNPKSPDGSKYTTDVLASLRNMVKQERINLNSQIEQK